MGINHTKVFQFICIERGRNTLRAVACKEWVCCITIKALAYGLEGMAHEEAGSGIHENLDKHIDFHRWTASYIRRNQVV